MNNKILILAAIIALIFGLPVAHALSPSKEVSYCSALISNDTRAIEYYKNLTTETGMADANLTREECKTILTSWENAQTDWNKGAPSDSPLCTIDMLTAAFAYVFQRIFDSFHF